MGRQVKDVFTQVSAAGIVKSRGVDGHRYRPVVIHQPAVFNQYFLYTQRCAVGIISCRTCFGMFFIDIIIGRTQAVYLYIDHGIADKYFVDGDLTFQHRREVNTQPYTLRHNQRIIFKWRCTVNDHIIQC